MECNVSLVHERRGEERRGEEEEEGGRRREGEKKNTHTFIVQIHHFDLERTVPLRALHFDIDPLPQAQVDARSASTCACGRGKRAIISPMHQGALLTRSPPIHCLPFHREANGPSLLFFPCPERLHSKGFFSQPHDPGAVSKNQKQYPVTPYADPPARGGRPAERP